MRAIVLYRRPDGDAVYREVTDNVELTIAILTAQGYIVLDVIDIGFSGGNPDGG